jgi:hypothetical protein
MLAWELPFDLLGPSLSGRLRELLVLLYWESACPSVVKLLGSWVGWIYGPRWSSPALSLMVALLLPGTRLSCLPMFTLCAGPVCYDEKRLAVLGACQAGSYHLCGSKLRVPAPPEARGDTN